MRRCRPCGIEKPLSEFNRDSGEYGGYRYYCKTCARDKKQAYLQKLKNTKGAQMNLNKFEALHRGQTVQAKKVYDAIPISEYWSIPQIMKELQRMNASMSDVHSVRGCVNSLIDSGLVSEPVRGNFRRVEIREKKPDKEPQLVAVKQPNGEQMKVSVYEVPAKATPIDRLSDLAKRLRDLATDMDDAAIELAEQAQKNEMETEKMRQLQALLKSLG